MIVDNDVIECWRASFRLDLTPRVNELESRLSELT